MKRNIIILMALLFSAPIIIIGVVQNDDDSILQHLPESIQPVAVNPPVPLQDFTLTSHKLKSVNKSDFTGKWSFVFFGYTNCPDICPATLSQLVLVNKLLQQKYQDVSPPQFYLVSVDNPRDTTEKLAAYIEYFNKDFVALRGNDSQLAIFEDIFGVFHRAEKADLRGNYAVAHSSETFLVNPDGEIVAKFSPPMDIPQIAQLYSQIVSYFDQPLS